MRGGQLKKIVGTIDVGEPLAILDFEYSDRADLWIDHHFNQDLGPDPVRNPRIFYNPAAKSTVSLIAEKYQCEEARKELVGMSNMIDSASYPNVNFIFESDHPLMILRAYLETAFPAEMMYCRIVEMITACNFDIEKALRRMRIGSESVKNVRNTAKRINRDMTVFGKCSVVNQSRQNQFPRYSEFLVSPGVEYAIRMSLSGPHNRYIQIGHNQWVGKPNKLNLGEFMRNLPYVRGGGHFGVAAGVIKNEDEQRFLDDVDIYFNTEEENMEKYGVDKNDPVENRAQELVKEGVDLSDAREQSQEEMEKRSDGPDKVELRSSDDIRETAGEG